jgi:hypothetical protein
MSITTAPMKPNDIKQAMRVLRCNKYHSGNRKVTYDVGHFVCQGCGEFHTTETAAETLAGTVGEITGGGGLVRIA